MKTLGDLHYNKPLTICIQVFPVRNNDPVAAFNFNRE